MNENKVVEKIIDNIEWGRGPQNSWRGTYTLSDGYTVSCVADPFMKMREAKSWIKEELPRLVLEVAAERNITIA